MPPKKQASKSSGKPSGKTDNVDEKPLQAVILADSYNRRFEVLCLDKPRILLPLCGIPLLHWTLECLSSSKVKQVFIFCGVHGDQIRDFVAESPFNKLLDIQCLSSTSVFTAGDALRELDDMHVLSPDNPFILVHNALVSNYDISEMVETHKKRRQTNPDVIMTMGVGRGGRIHPESPIMLVHPPSSRLLNYIQNPISPRRQRVAFPANLFLEPWPATIDEYEVWSGTSASSSLGGYRDLGIDICEADVPALCTENFDYHDLRRHFVNGVLTSELLGKYINVHLVGDQQSGGDVKDLKSKIQSGRYVERVRDTRSYGDTANDILRRWVFPLVPDVKLPGATDYELRRGNIYVSREHVLLSRTTTLVGPLLIGSRCDLDNNTTIQGSTLGANCKVGANTTISNSHIFGDARIGDKCVLTECIMGYGVTLGDNVTIGRGCLIGDGVKIESGVTIEDFARIGREKYRPDDYDSDDESDDDAEGSKALGANSVGFVWPKEEEEADIDSDDEGEDPYEHPRNKKLLQLGRRLSNISQSTASVSTLSVASSDDEMDTPLSLASDDDLDAVGHLNLNDGPAPAFFTECRASLARAFLEDHSIPNALLEIKTLVMGYNSGIDLAREEVVNSLMEQVPTEGGAAKILAAATAFWERWGGLAAALCRDTSEIALDVQAYCVRNDAYAPWFGVYLRALYDGDVVDEDGLVEWRSLSAARGEGAKESEREKFKEVYLKGKQYVDVLEDMDSSSDEDDDEEDSDDE